MRLNINLSDELVPELDKRAKRFHVSRSSYISICVSRQMQMDEMTENMPTFFEIANKFKDLDLEQLKTVNK